MDEIVLAWLTFCVCVFFHLNGCSGNKELVALVADSGTETVSRFEISDTNGNLNYLSGQTCTIPYTSPEFASDARKAVIGCDGNIYITMGNGGSFSSVALCNGTTMEFIKFIVRKREEADLQLDSAWGITFGDCNYNYSEYNNYSYNYRFYVASKYNVLEFELNTLNYTANAIDKQTGNIITSGEDILLDSWFIYGSCNSGFDATQCDDGDQSKCHCFQPYDIVWHNNTFIVSNPGNNLLIKYDCNGNYITSLRVYYTSDGTQGVTTGVAIDHRRDIAYVNILLAQPYAQVVQVDITGTSMSIVKTVTLNGIGYSQESGNERINGIAFDALNDNVYIVMSDYQSADKDKIFMLDFNDSMMLNGDYMIAYNRSDSVIEIPTGIAIGLLPQITFENTIVSTSYGASDGTAKQFSINLLYYILQMSCFLIGLVM